MRIVTKERRRVQEGDVFGKWTVLGVEFYGPNHQSYVVAQCDCGRVSAVRSFRLTNEESRCCDYCGRRTGIKHGDTQGKRASRLYRIWVGMIGRCQNPKNKSFQNYGGRGITVCREWREFKSFREWALKSGYSGQLSLDREMVDGDYTPSNCRFATDQQQQRNRRNNRQVTAFGETKLLCEWPEDSRCVVSRATLLARLRYGWGAEDAITQPIQTTRRAVFSRHAKRS